MAPYQMPNPTVKQITAARERAQRIREFADQFRREINLERTEITSQTETQDTNVRLFVVKLPTRKSQREAA